MSRHQLHRTIAKMHCAHTNTHTQQSFKWNSRKINAYRCKIWDRPAQMKKTASHVLLLSIWKQFVSRSHILRSNRWSILNFQHFDINFQSESINARFSFAVLKQTIKMQSISRCCALSLSRSLTYCVLGMWCILWRGVILRRILFSMSFFFSLLSALNPI